MVIILFYQDIKYKLCPDFIAHSNMKCYVPSVFPLVLTFLLKFQRMASMADL